MTVQMSRLPDPGRTDVSVPRRVRPARRGFTLIEIMVVVAIVAILASIAIPRFLSYQLTAKSAEARTMIGGLIATQQTFAAEYENYANITVPNPVGVPSINRQVWGTVPCPVTCSRINPTDCTSFECIGFQPPSAVYFQYTSPHRLALGNAPAEFAIGAAADLDGDGNRGSFAYRSANYGGSVGVVADGLSTCPANILSSTVENCAIFDF